MEIFRPVLNICQRIKKIPISSLWPNDVIVPTSKIVVLHNTICYRDERDNFLKELGRENTQLLINAVWGLPTERVEEVIVAKFPPPTYKLPREKPLPTPKVLTKWEKYAKDKGRNNISGTRCMAEDIGIFVQSDCITSNIIFLYT